MTETPLICAAPPDTGDTISLSWSRLSAYEKCHQQVKRRMEGKSTRIDGRKFIHGTIADRAMRRYLETPGGPVEGTLLDFVPDLMREYTKDDGEYFINWKGNKADDMKSVEDKVIRVLTALEPLLWKYVIPNGYEPEYRFATFIGVPNLDGGVSRVKLIGGIDILTCSLNDAGEFDENSEYGVFDLKATENDAYVRGATLAQLTFYAIACRAMFGKLPKYTAFLTPACQEKVVPVRVTDEEIRVMMTRIISYCHGVWKEEWAPKDKVDSDCMYNCDVRHACDLFALPPNRPVSFTEIAQRRAKARA